MIDYIALVIWTLVVSGVSYSYGIPKRNHELLMKLRMRASIRRQIPTRKSVQEGKPDRIADLLDEAATEIEKITQQ